MDKNLPRGLKRRKVSLWEIISSCVSYKNCPWKAIEHWDNKSANDTKLFRLITTRRSCEELQKTITNQDNRQLDKQMKCDITKCKVECIRKRNANLPSLKCKALIFLSLRISKTWVINKHKNWNIISKVVYMSIFQSYLVSWLTPGLLVTSLLNRCFKMKGAPKEWNYWSCREKCPVKGGWEG